MRVARYPEGVVGYAFQNSTTFWGKHKRLPSGDRAFSEFFAAARISGLNVWIATTRTLAWTAIIDTSFCGAWHPHLLLTEQARDRRGHQSPGRALPPSRGRLLRGFRVS